MTDYEGIKEKIDELKSDALSIENEISYFFTLAENFSKHLKDNDMVDLDLHPNYWTWKSLDKDLSEYHKSLIKHYESWYYQSHSLIQEFYVDKEPIFKELHDGRMVDYTGPDSVFDKTIVSKKIHDFYGISELLQLNNYIQRHYGPRSITHEILALFSKQQGILIALPGIVRHLPDKIENQEKKLPASQMKESVQIPSIIIQQQQFATQSNETIINIQSFSQANEFIENYVNNEKFKNELKQEVKEFEKIHDKLEYLKKFQKFVGILGDYISVLGPVIQFLTQHIPK